MIPRLALSAWLVAALTATAQQPARTDFSGEWVLDASKSTSSGAPMSVSGPPLARGGPPPAVAPGTLREPRKIKDVPPRYPPEAQQARIAGIVVLEAIIDRRGKVDDLRVVRSVPQLDRAALEAVSQWEYTPTMLDGVAVPVIMTVTITFALNGGRPQMGDPVGGGWPSQPAGALRPGYGRGFAPPVLSIRQDDDGLTMMRKFENGSEEVKYRFDGKASRNRLPGTGGAIDNVYSFVSRLDGSKLVTTISWKGPQGERERVETMSLIDDVLTIETLRPAARGAGDPFIQTNVFVRKK